MCKWHLHFYRMADRRSSSQQRLLQAAVQLFIAQGVTETTTKQIADLAEVNEVTLFRNFGSKYGLLLAMMEDPQMLQQLGMALGKRQTQMESASQSLKNYATVHLHALEQIQEFVRSLIGEAAHYPIENRRALGRSLSQANRYTAQYLAAVMRNEQLQTRMTTDKLATLLNSLLLGYAVLEFTSEINELWQNRESFVEGLVDLFLYGAVASPPNFVEASPSLRGAIAPVRDLSLQTVHMILKRAKKLGMQEFAIAYLMVAAGLDPEEIVTLRRSDVEINRQAISVRFSNRQVPLSLVLGDRRYGSPQSNPLSQWLKSRKDTYPTLFFNGAGHPISVPVVEQLWLTIAADPGAAPDATPVPEQAQDTWRVEMLMRGVTLENLSLLTGLTVADLQPYVRRAREKAAMEQAIQVDHKATTTKREKLPAPLLEGNLLEANLPDVAPEL